MNRLIRTFLILPLVAMAGESSLVWGVEPESARLSASSLAAKLEAKPQGADASALADQVRTWFGGAANLAKGPNPKVEGTWVAWAIESKGTPKIVSEDGKFTAELTRLGSSDLYATALHLAEGFGARWAFEIDGKPIPHPNSNPRLGTTWAQIEVYNDPPESREQPGVPKGKLLDMPKFHSKIFEGTSRDWWVYVPAQYSDQTPAAVMVFQDGGGYKGFVPTVFDNLIAKKEMPITVGIFIQPGTFDDKRSNRSFEYDTLSDQYARFLLDEILPATENGAKVKLRHDPAGRAIAGISSGGICSWTVAWERPNEFSKVLSWVGSFTNIASGKSGREGGHNYEALIRKSSNKPIRAFLQDGANDLDNNNGNWPLANQQMAKSLAFKKYDYKFVLGQGFHSNLHGRSILPDSLRWLWRGWESELPK